MSFVISACAGLLESKQPSERIYWLEPIILQQEVNVDAVVPSIAVSVSAVPGLDTNRLLVLDSDAHLNYYASARWPDNVSEVLESLLRTTLESTGRYSRVAGAVASQPTDLQLDLELRELFVLENAAKSSQEVRLFLKGNLNCDTGARGIIIQAAIEIRDYRLAKIVAAYQQALNDASKQLVAQTAELCGVTKQIIN